MITTDMSFVVRYFLKGNVVKISLHGAVNLETRLNSMKLEVCKESCLLFFF